MECVWFVGKKGEFETKTEGSLYAEERGLDVRRRNKIGFLKSTNMLEQIRKMFMISGGET